MTANSRYAVSTLQIARAKLNKANGGARERWWLGRNEFFSSSFKGSACGPSKFHVERIQRIKLREPRRIEGRASFRLVVENLSSARIYIYIASHDRIESILANKKFVSRFMEKLLKSIVGKIIVARLS